MRIALDEPEKAITDLERALRLSPIDPGRFYPLTVLARAHVLCRRYDKALPLVADSLRLRPNYQSALADATVAHAMAGQLDAAQRFRIAHQKAYPGMRIATFRERMGHLSASGFDIDRNAQCFGCRKPSAATPAAAAVCRKGHPVHSSV